MGLPDKWPYKWVTEVIAPTCGFITLLITSRGHLLLLVPVFWDTFAFGSYNCLNLIGHQWIEGRLSRTPKHLGLPGPMPFPHFKGFLWEWCGSSIGTGSGNEWYCWLAVTCYGILILADQKISEAENGKDKNIPIKRIIPRHSWWGSLTALPQEMFGGFWHLSSPGMPGCLAI